MMNRHILLLFVLLGFLKPVLPQNTPPRFVFEPVIARPGDLVHVQASNFAPESTLAVVLLASEEIKETTLGVVPIVNGVFQATFRIPSSQPAGSYLVRVGANPGKSAINFTGTLSVVTLNEPWFAIHPTTAAPGEDVTVFGGGFQNSGSFVSLILLDSLGRLRKLDFAPLFGGSFQKQVQLPPTLPARRSYSLLVRNPQEFADGISGPITAAFGVVQPAIPVGTYPVGAAVNPQKNRIYVPNAADNTLSILDGAAHVELDRIAAGELPCAIAVDPQHDRIYVANTNGYDLSIINGQTHQIEAAVEVGEFPCAVGVLPDLQRVFVGNYVGDTVSVVDAGTATRITDIPVAGPPFGMAVNPVTNRVYVATGVADVVTVIDGTTLDIIAEIPVGKGPDAVGVDHERNRVYIANYFSHTLSILDGSTNTILSTVPVGKEPSGVAVNTTTGRVFIGNYAGNTVSVVDGIHGLLLASLAVGTTPDGMAANSVTGRVYSVNSNTNDVSVIQDIATTK